MSCGSCSGSGDCVYCYGTGYDGGIARAGTCRAVQYPEYVQVATGKDNTSFGDYKE